MIVRQPNRHVHAHRRGYWQPECLAYCQDTPSRSSSQRPQSGGRSRPGPSTSSAPEPAYRPRSRGDQDGVLCPPVRPASRGTRRGPACRGPYCAGELPAEVGGGLASSRPATGLPLQLCPDPRGARAARAWRPSRPRPAGAYAIPVGPGCFAHIGADRAFSKAREAAPRAHGQRRPGIRRSAIDLRSAHSPRHTYYFLFLWTRDAEFTRSFLDLPRAVDRRPDPARSTQPRPGMALPYSAPDRRAGRPAVRDGQFG